MTTSREENGIPEPWYWEGHQIYSVLESVWEKFAMRNNLWPSCLLNSNEFEWLYATEQIWAETENLS